jgi:hypothetical protein
LAGCWIPPSVECITSWLVGNTQGGRAWRRH